MTDLITLLAQAGHGGHGRVSFRREKYVPKGGPDGGRGGDGGHVIVRGTSELATLNHFAGVREVVAEDGQIGGERKKIGSRGKNFVIEVPLGTTIWEIAENQPAGRRQRRYGIERLMPRDEQHRETYEVEFGQGGVPGKQKDSLEWLVPTKDLQDETILTGKEFKLLKDTKQLVKLVEILEEGQEVVLCQAGLGGRGNEAFKSGALTTPRLAEYGTIGEARMVVLEQRLLADVGLVGFPSAGKSTLLSVLTQARPKIAAYPFTTLEPNLGILSSTERPEHQPGLKTGVAELILADIPGLIEGASEGKGLGIDFLRHIENTTMVLFVLALDETAIFDENLTESEKAQELWKQYQVLLGELRKHSPEMLEKTQCVSVNKIDVYPSELRAAIRAVFESQGLTDVVLFSSATGEGLDELRSVLFELSALKSSAVSGAGVQEQL
jgi:GTP-binding protein